MSLPLLVFFLLPLAALLLRAPLPDIWENLQKIEVRQAIVLSFKTTSIALALTILCGTPLAYTLARRQFRLRRVVDALVDLPTVLPPAVAGVALLLTFGRRGVFGPLLASMGAQVAFTQIAVVMAQVFIAAPFYVKAAQAGFANVNYELEQAASLDGANRWQVFRFVTAPLSWVSLLSGALMSWARALGEFGATIIFAGNLPGVTQTMPLAIYLGFEIDLDIALTLAVILVGCSFLALILVKGVLENRAAAL